MIVDDNPKMREMIKRAIVENVNSVKTIHECTDGREAIECYKEARPDWVLMDIQMEPVDGLTATRTIRNSYPDAKIIIVTAFGDGTYREAARSAGVYAFVLKENLRELPAILAGEASSGNAERRTF